VRGGIPWNVERFDLSASPTTPDLASRFPHARDVLLEGRSHYIPMESPDLVAEELSR
jgi:pimeloyl-ACP methyl ester carboxylesterase